MIWLDKDGAAPDLFPRYASYPATVASIGRIASFDEADLAPAERRYVANAVQKRRREFIAGRFLARQSLDRLGIGQPVLPRAQDRTPVWPAGVTGSISHCRHLAVAVVSTQLSSVGVDIECRERLDDRPCPTLFTPIELENRLFDAGPSALFSAKEAVFKAVYPFKRQLLEFLDIEIHALDLARQEFRARPVHRADLGLVRYIQGTIVVSRCHVLTLAIVPAEVGRRGSRPDSSAW